MNSRKNIDASPTTQNKDISSAARDKVLERAEKDYEEFKETHTFKFPTWLYGPPKASSLKLKLRIVHDLGTKLMLNLILLEQLF
jgi:biuret amidohydrolase